MGYNTSKPVQGLVPTATRNAIFGGDRPWQPLDWTASDDRVRGGASQSYLSCDGMTSGPARFYGELDIKRLGGAGFASQRTTAEEKSWDLSEFDGIEIIVGQSDGKRYTLVLRDELPGKREDGRDKAGISYEADFTTSQNGREEQQDRQSSQVFGSHQAESSKQKTFIPFVEFKATYRGKGKPDAKPLDTKNIRRWNIMMRSHFGEQEGPFSVEVVLIAAVQKRSSEAPELNNSGIF